MKIGFLLALVSALLGLLGRISWCHAVPMGLSLDAASLLKLLLDWRMLASFAIYAFSTLAWLAAPSRGELSELYPVISLNYALVLIVGWLLFGESVTAAKVFGVALILADVAAVALS